MNEHNKTQALERATDSTPGQEAVRTFLRMLAFNRDLLALIIDAPGRTLPACLARFSISLNDFTAELQRMKDACSDSGNRELHDDELRAVVGGVPSDTLSLSEINQLLGGLRNIQNS